MSELERLFDELDTHVKGAGRGSPADARQMADMILTARVKAAKLLGAMTSAAGADERVARDAKFAAELSERLFAARQALGRLQAKWRMAEVMGDPKTYSSESAPVAEKIKDFVYWARKELRAR